MNWSRLQGEQYVRLGPGAAEAVAPYIGATASEIDELVLDVRTWPEEIRPTPIRGWDGRLIAGDPILVDASDAGLLLATGGSIPGTVLIPWEHVRTLDVVGRLEQRAGA